MESRITRRLLGAVVREEKGMNPFRLKCGLALALTCAGFLYVHMRTKRIKRSTTYKGHQTRQGSQTNLGGGMRKSTSFCGDVPVEHTLDIPEEECITKTISTNSLVAVSQKTKPAEENEEYTVKETGYKGGDTFNKDVVEAPRPRVDSPAAAHEDCEQEIRKLRNTVVMLQERERKLEVKLLEYCGLREQEAAVMELQNRLKLSDMEAKMFTMKVETLQADNRRLEAQLADHGRVVAELEAAKAKVKLLKKKIRYEAEQNRDQIMSLKQIVSKLQDQESKAAAASERDAQERLNRLKEIESEAEELRKSNMMLQMENADLARRLESTQILANAVLEVPEIEEQMRESEQLREEKEKLEKEMDQMKLDRCSEWEELVYLRWINACLRHELRHCQPPPGKTTARDLSKSLSPTSEKKAKQLILEYANMDNGAENQTPYSDWSSSQNTPFTIDSMEGEDYSPRDNSANPSHHKSRIFGKLIKLIRGKDSHSHHGVGRVTSQERSRSSENSNSPHFRRTISAGTNDEGGDGVRSEFGTSSEAARDSLDYQKILGLKESDRRNSDSIVQISSPKSLGPNDTQHSPAKDRSDLVKYAEALKDSSPASVGKVVIHRKSASYSSF